MRKLFRTRGEWRNWLIRNHSTENEVWLVYYKKHTGKACIPYNDAVEEAVCFGWIDGKVLSIDDEQYMQRYTPRRKNSLWSFSNKRRAEKMIRLGEMTPAGMKLVETAKKSGKWDDAYSSKNDFSVPDDLIYELKKNKVAWNFFNGLAKGYKYSYAYWVGLTKSKSSRERRIMKVVERCAREKKPGM